MDKYEVRSIVEEVISKTTKLKRCPSCEEDIRMIRLDRYVADDYQVQYRCLGCLKLYKEVMVEVTS